MKRAATRECVLLEVVSRDARPHPEERACARRSANSKARARVSKDEDVHAALMLRDASQRIWALEAPALPSRCDAPQHEGREAATCGCTKPGPGQFRCFGLLFTMTFATHTCRAAEGPICYLKRVTPYVTPIWHHPSSSQSSSQSSCPCVTIRRHNVLCI
jgi:hypothetical protein